VDVHSTNSRYGNLFDLLANINGRGTEERPVTWKLAFNLKLELELGSRLEWLTGKARIEITWDIQAMCSITYERGPSWDNIRGAI